MDKNYLKPLFQKARADLYYPPIIEFEIANVTTSEVNFKTSKYKILLGKEFISNLSQNAIIGVFHHELNHWAKHPYDVKTIILETNWLGERKHKVIIRNLFDDVIANLDLIINKGLKEIAQLYQEMPVINKADHLLRAFYQEVTGLYFGEIKIDEKLKEKLDALFQIDFLDTGRARLKNNIKQFAKIIEDLIEDIKWPFSFFSWENFCPHEIKKAMNEIANEVDIREFEKIAQEVYGKPFLVEKGLGIQPGKKEKASPFIPPETAWYEIRAQRYAIYISGIEKTDSLYPSEIKDFSLEDPIETYSFIESYGQILPGISKRYEMSYFEGECKVKVPDAVIVIDSSGSMKHPDRELSYAVLAAFAIARNYFEAGAKVGVINFSDKNIELFPTRERYKVYQLLKFHQTGGTTLHIEEFKHYINKVGNVDCILITDAGIDNLSSLIKILSHLKQRLTIIWIKTDVGRTYGFESQYQMLKQALPSWVTFVEIEDERDIPNIAIGKSFARYVRDKEIT
ncbi:MAG: VWA domain-containing protein [Candidatus Desulfofervidus auxilii]|nr:VWA domain-containing protein [Candidatus Desulfofervidus auxilii]